MKLESLRRTFGIAEPVRRAMELKIVDQGEWRPAVLGGGVGLHGDILRGMDGGCSYEDIFTGMLICYDKGTLGYTLISAL